MFVKEKKSLIVIAKYLLRISGMTFAPKIESENSMRICAMKYQFLLFKKKKLTILIE